MVQGPVYGIGSSCHVGDEEFEKGLPPRVRSRLSKSVGPEELCKRKLKPRLREFEESLNGQCNGIRSLTIPWHQKNSNKGCYQEFEQSLQNLWLPQSCGRPSLERVRTEPEWTVCRHGKPDHPMAHPRIRTRVTTKNSTRADG